MNATMQSFHPILQQWFQERLGAPTPAQEKGWPLLRSGQNTLIAAPTGGGKTLAAFFVAIDQLLQQSLEHRLEPGVQILYLSPLRALSHDVKKNLERPLAEIMERVQAQGLNPSPIRIGLRTGDSTQAERARLLKHPPHILVTTPESLFLLLSSAKGQTLLRSIHTVIVDEIHALARDKRGSHMSLSLEHLSSICEIEPVRIGLSATQKPLDRIAQFLVGPERACEIVDVSQQRHADLAIVTPDTPLSTICSHDMWAEVYAKLADLIKDHHSSLIFVNTRRMAERITFQLSEILGEDAVACHHGSLSKDKRLAAEERLKEGTIKAIVATSSLELGIDVGTVDLVCQIASPGAISAFVQRVGRSGHALGLIPKARLFALTRDELLECMTLLRAYREGTLESVEIPEQPIDILAQHIVSLVSAEERRIDPILELCRRAYPFRNLDKTTLEKVLQWLSEGLGHNTRRGAYLHWDKLEDTIKARRGARLAVVTSGGAIPEQNLYRVVNEADQSFVGTVDEEFALESARGDIFLLGNHSWQISRLKGDVLLVQDRQGAPPSIPFWKGEAGGRSYELSHEVSRLRGEASDFYAVQGYPSAEESSFDAGQIQKEFLKVLVPRLEQQFQIPNVQALQAAEYLSTQQLALGLIPTQQNIVYERFFDETGGMQLVVHAPFGSRINRAWGLAFRKRFCRGFDFELQATATDNGILLSVGPNQSFPLDAMFRMLNAKICREVLIQALLDVPMFEIRWRWNVTRALAVLRNKAGKRVPPHLQRYQSNDLLTAVFPMQTQCFEHRTGDLEIPDHPLVEQTVRDCLQEAMDTDRFCEIMKLIDEKQVTLVARDTREPSPFCYELIHANPYAFLDDAPLEERRVRALSTRRTLDPSVFQDLGSLAPAAISQVSSEAWPWIRDADELYEAIKQLILVDKRVIAFHSEQLPQLEQRGRVMTLDLGGQSFVFVHERKESIAAIFPKSFPKLKLPVDDPVFWEEQATALRLLLRGQLECRGPLRAAQLAEEFSLDADLVHAALQQLEGQGIILSGYFSDDRAKGMEVEWCERRLLQRMHRLTIEGLREQIKPVPIASYLTFLSQHQMLGTQQRVSGSEGLTRLIELLQGYEAPAVTWENELLRSRMQDFNSGLVDQLCHSGTMVWGRIRIPSNKDKKPGHQRLFGRQTAINFTLRHSLPWLVTGTREIDKEFVSEMGQKVWELFQQRGALFYDELARLLGSSAKAFPQHLEDALSELISYGLLHSDGFAAMRPLVNPDRRLRKGLSQGPRNIRFESDFRSGGRFAVFAAHIEPASASERLEAWAWQLLKRYGIVFRDLLAREKLAPSWSELVGVYRVLEARGQIRGGRFVEKVGGEQYAMKEVIPLLRAIKDAAQQGPSEFIVLAASDPANLMGTIDGSAKIPNLSGNRVVLYKGRFVAWKNRDEIHFEDGPLSVELRTTMERALRLNGMFRQHDPFLKMPIPDSALKIEGADVSTKRPFLKNWRQLIQV